MRSIINTLILPLLVICMLDGKKANADFTFGTPTNLGPVVNKGPNFNTPADETSTKVSFDGLSLVFASKRPGGLGNFDLWIATRTTTDDQWSDPVWLGETVNSMYTDTEPSMSSDGLALYFRSTRPGGAGGSDIWITKRTSVFESWGAPENLGSIINSQYSDAAPCISPNGLSLYFSSSRPGGSGSYDIWVATRTTTGDSWGTPVNAGSTVNSSSADDGPTISSNGLSLYFHSRRSGGFGKDDIWVSKKAGISNPWSRPVNLGPTVNNSSNQAWASVSPDGFTLYLCKDWYAGFAGWEIFTGKRTSLEEPFTAVDWISSLDSHPRISNDGLTLYFTSNRPGGQGEGDIWISERTSATEPWSEPINLGPPVNTSAIEAFPEISADGLTLIFASVRQEGYGWFDMYVATRDTVDGPWTEPVNLGPVINDVAAQDGQSLSPDGLTMYFVSCANWPGQVGSCDIYMTTRATVYDSWGPPVNLGPTVNSGSSEYLTDLSSDELVMFFTSWRSGGVGDTDLYMTQRRTTSDPFSPPVNLGPSVNSIYTDSSECVSSDGSVLYFSSNRYGGRGGMDIWQVPIIPIVDFNSDGIVDGADMCIMVDNWGTDSQLYDIGPMPWGDGIVDVQDLVALAEHLFEETPPTEPVE